MLQVVDPNPLNRVVRHVQHGRGAGADHPTGQDSAAAMSQYRWRGKRTLEITVRDAEVFADGTWLDAGSVRRAFDEQIRWEAPHPPGTHFNIDRRTRAEVVDDRTVRLHLPKVDGLALGKLRDTRDERAVLARSGFWLRPRPVRRGPLVNY
jgi:hypothetical protein